MGEQVAAGVEKKRKSEVVLTIHGGVAQLGEHLPCKQGVKSSNLSISIRPEKDRRLSAMIAHKFFCVL